MLTLADSHELTGLSLHLHMRNIPGDSYFWKGGGGEGGGDGAPITMGQYAAEATSGLGSNIMKDRQFSVSLSALASLLFCCASLYCKLAGSHSFIDLHIDCLFNL